ncbi:MAG TPA: hypothetical protein PKA27_01155 [Fimbriimonadaceae bacterium]|nr:hypothetical protein [Fimbriimonadaceae bacterium]
MTLALITMASSAPSVMIDSFTPIDHTYDRTLSTPFSGRSVVDVVTGDMLGGERDREIRHSLDSQFGTVYARYEYNSFYQREFYAVGGVGRSIANGGSAGSAVVTLQYDGTGDEQGNTGFGKSINNSGVRQGLGLSGLGGFRIWHTSDSSQIFEVRALLRRNGEVLETVTNWLGYANLFIEAMPFAFSEGSLAAADSVSFEFYFPTDSGSPRWEQISHIDTILPEPGTWLAMAGGLALLLRRGRKVRR